MKEQKELLMSDFVIVPTQREDIPDVLSLIQSVPDALVSVKEIEIESWIDKGFSLVAKDKKGSIIGHQSAYVWPESGWVEVRSAIVKPEFRGRGINTEMKKMMIARIRNQNPDAVIIGFTEAASKSRGILQKLGFVDYSLADMPEEFFTICPENCVKKTGVDCGCKVFMLKPIKEVTSGE